MRNLSKPRATAFLFLLGLVCTFAVLPVKAQRILATMDPVAQGHDLVFDINENTDDNIAPNMLFSPDGTKVYVAYAGSGTVISFDPHTGQILSKVNTGGKPSQIFYTPDGTRLLAINCFSHQIFVIDLSSFTLAATWSFPDAQFGFGNNIVFSADGKTGYITTILYEPRFLMPDYGKLIRFSTSDGTESGERLKVGKGPIRISLSPDKKTMAIVNTASDDISIVDLPTFSVRATMDPDSLDDDDTDVYANFTYVNTVAFSNDGTIGAVCNRASAASVLTSDQAYIFQMSDGAILKSISAGNAPTESYITPDGKYFLFLNQFGFKVVDASTYELIHDVSSSYTEFTGNTNMAFPSGDKDLGYVSSPGQDVIMTFRFSTGGIESNMALTEDVANYFDENDDDEDEEEEEDEDEVDTNKQSMQTAVSPDGKIVLVLNFKANTIYSIVATYNAQAPFDSNSSSFSGLSLVNTTDAPINFHLEVADINNQTFTNVDVNYNLYEDEEIALTSSNRLAQSFKIHTEKETTGLVRLFLKRTGDFSSSAKLQLKIETNDELDEDDDGDDADIPSGTQVDNAIGEINVQDIPTELTFVDIRFAKKAPLVTDKTYWLVLSGTGTYSSEYAASTRMVEWGVDGSDSIYSNGTLATYASSTWTADEEKDALFNVIVSEVNAAKELVLQPKQQMSFTQDDFGLDDRDRRGRFFIKAETPGLKGYWVGGRRDLTTLDGGNLITTKAKKMLLPEVQQIGDIYVGYNKNYDEDVLLLSKGKLAQSFMLESPTSVQRVQLYLLRYGTFSAEATLTVSVQTNDNGKPSGNVITNATATILTQDVYTSYSNFEFKFENAAALEGSTVYWLVLEGSGDYSTEYYEDERFIYWGVDPDDPGFYDGQFSVYSSSAWTTDNTKDALFKVIVAEQFNLETTINLINQNWNFVSGTLDLVDIDGESIQTSSSSWPGLIRYAGNFETHLSPGISDRTDGYINLKGASDFSVYEEIGTASGKAVIQGIPLNDEAYLVDKLYFPHYSSGDIPTQFSLINLSQEFGYFGDQDETVILTDTNKLAQTFQMEESANVNVVRVMMKRTGSFKDTAKFKFHLELDKSGLPSGTIVPGSTVEFLADDDLETTVSRLNIRFEASIYMTTGVTYWLILEPAGTYVSEYKEGKKQIEWGVDATSPTYTQGKFYKYDGTTWAEDIVEDDDDDDDDNGENKDAVFQVSLAEDNETVVSLFSSNGDLMARTGKIVMESGGQYKSNNLFPELNSYQLRQGWIMVEGTKPGIAGSVVFTNAPRDFLTGGIMQSQGLTDILFAQVAHGSDWETGWSFLNYGNTTADVTIEIYNPQGNVVQSAKLQLGPRNSRAFYFEDIFPGAPDILAGYVRVRSTQPLISFSLLTDTLVNFLATVPAQPWQ